MKQLKRILPGVFLFFIAGLTAQTPQWALFETDPFANQMVRQGNTIWIHTIHGMVKVDINSGQKSVFNTLNSGLNNHRNAGIGLDSMGTLWVASELDGLFTRTPDDIWQPVDVTYADTLRAVSAPAPAAGGRVFLLARSLATYKPYLLIWENQQMTVSTFPPGFNNVLGGNIIADKTGDLWLVMPKDDTGYAQHLLRWHQGDWQVFSPSQFEATLDEGFVIPWLAPAPDSSIFIHTYALYTQSSIKNKVFRLKDGQIEHYKMPYLSLFENGNACTGLGIDQTSRPWVSTSDHQIWRYNAPEDWTPFNLQNLGVPADGSDNRFLFDAQNNIWFLGANDLYKTDMQQPATVTHLVQTDITDFQCWGLTIAPNGRVWFGGGLGLSYFDGNAWTFVQGPWGDSYRNITHLQADSMGNVWYLPLTSSALGRSDGQQYFIKDLTRPNTTEGYQSRTDLDIDREGNKWVCTGEAELLRVKNNIIKYFLVPGAADSIFKVAVDAAGKVWAIGRNIYQVENDQLVLKYNANFPRVTDAVFQGNTLVIADWRGVIHRYDGATLVSDQTLLTYPQPLFEGLYPSLATDKKGNLWVGAYNGLYWQNDLGNWTEVSTRTSRIIDNFVEQVTTDACNNVWLWAYNALMVYNPDGLDGNCTLLNTKAPPTEPLPLLSCWPNPATSVVNFSLADNNRALESIQVFAENGRCVLSVRPNHQTTVSVLVQALAAGWYTAVASDAAGGVYRGRFLVAR